jgi:N-methylhydantoinase A
MDRYLGELERGPRRSISIMQSNGGFMSTKEARRHAIRTVLSGPAGGVVGALETARLSGFPRILGFDMGGTSTDVSLSDGQPRETMEASIDGFPVRVPMLDIHTVGAGGGSIARVDEGGLLRVGPQSAGADPGLLVTELATSQRSPMLMSCWAAFMPTSSSAGKCISMWHAPAWRSIRSLPGCGWIG